MSEDTNIMAIGVPEREIVPDPRNCSSRLASRALFLEVTKVEAASRLRRNMPPLSQG